VLMSDYKAIDKVLQEMAGKSVADGTARGLDHDLHSNLTKWRQCLMMLHREATDVEKDDREEFASQVSIEDKVKVVRRPVYGGNPAGPPCRNFAKGTCVETLLARGCLFAG